MMDGMDLSWICVNLSQPANSSSSSSSGIVVVVVERPFAQPIRLGAYGLQQD